MHRVTDKPPFAALAALLLSLAAATSPASAGPPPLASGDGPVDISADSFSVESNGWIRADGNVLVRQGDTQVTADHMRVNKDTGDIDARGDVVLARKGQATSRTQQLSFNYKTGTGLTGRFDVQAGVLRIIADKARRTPDGTYELENALVTTCTNSPGRLHYAARGRRAVYAPERYVVLDGMTLRLRGVPVFYFPRWKRNLAEHYGWRFEPGYDSEWGGYLLSTYKRQLADFGGEHKDSLDSATHIDYRTERGFAAGEELSWHFGDPGAFDGYHVGRIAVYGVLDDKPMDDGLDRAAARDVADEERYRITLRHDSFLTPRDYLTLRTSFMSDSYMLEDFYEDEYRAMVQPESYASYTHAGDGYSLGVGAYHRMNDFYESVNRLPEAWIDVLRTPVAGTGLYYESQTRGGLLEREFAEYGAPGETAREPYDSLRIDSRHTLRLPAKLFGWLNVIPRAGYRGTYYGDSPGTPCDGAIDAEAPAATNPAPAAAASGGGSKFRNLLELGAEVSYKLYGLYEDGDGDAYRHVVQPYLDYTYVPDADVRPDELFRFDSIDDADETHSVRAGLRQLVQRWSPDGAVPLADLDPYAVFDLDDEDGGAGLDAICVDGKFRPADSIRIELEAEYDYRASDFDHVDFWMTLWNGDRWEAAGSAYYVPDDCTLLTGAVTYSLSETWDVSAYARYDSESSRLEEISGYVQMNLDCLSFRLRGSFEPSFTRDDGSEREAKYKIAFYTWLRAFAPERYGRKLRDRYF